MNSHRERVIALAAGHALPAIYAWREPRRGRRLDELLAGGLMSYGSSQPRCLSPSRYLRRADTQRREAGRLAGLAVHEI
jgi:hypothetical protein